MFNPPMKSLTFNRKQAINLQRKSIDWFLPDISFHRKGLLNSPEHKKIPYKKHTSKI